MNQIDSKEYLLKELQLVEHWEKEQKDLWIWEKLGRLPFMLLDKVTPKFIQDKISQVVDEIGGYIQSGGRYLISEQTILSRFASKLPNTEGPITLTIDQVDNFPLETMDSIAKEIKATRAQLAQIQGSTTGIGGIFTLAIDIPLLLGLSLKTLQEIAICYGYDPNEKAERIFIVKCLQFASSDIVGKKAILEELAAYDRKAEDRRQVMSQVQGWREVLTTYRDNFGWKKLFQMIPIAGMVFGAYINKSSIEDIAETGMMLYRKRRILERLQ